MSVGQDLERNVRHLAARRVPVPRIVRLSGLPTNAVEAILRGAPWRHLAVPRAIGDLFGANPRRPRLSALVAIE